MATGTSKEVKRRNSILKEVLECAENEKADDQTSNNTRRSLKRVSFADTTSIKLFLAGRREEDTQCNSRYEGTINTDSTMDITSLDYQNTVNETESSTTKPTILLERRTDAAVPTEPKKDDTQDYERISDFLSNFIGYKATAPSAGIRQNETKLGSSMMDITSGIHQPEQLQNFSSHHSQNEGDVDMEMTCNFKITPMAKSLPTEKESEDRIRLPNVTSSETMCQINSSSNALVDNESNMCKDYTCVIPCGIDITCSEDFNKSLLQKSVNIIKSDFVDSQQSDALISDAVECTVCIGDGRTSPNTMDLTCVAGKELDKNNLNLSRDRTHMDYGKIEAGLSESRPEVEIAPANPPPLAIDSSKVKPKILQESSRSDAETLLTLNKASVEDLEKSISAPSSERPIDEPTLQNGRSHTNVNLMTTSDMLDLTNIPTDAKENFGLHLLESKFDASSTSFEYGQIKSELKSSQQFSVSSNCEDNSQKQSDAKLSYATKDPSSLGFNDNQALQVVIEPPDPLRSSCSADVHVENRDSELQTSGSCRDFTSTPSSLSTKSSEFSLVAIDSMSPIPPESAEIAGLLTAPITNRENRDINVSLICGSVQFSEVGLPVNTVPFREDSDDLERNTVNKNCDVSIDSKTELEKSFGIVVEKKSLNNPAVTSPEIETESVREKTVKKTTKKLLLGEDDPILQEEQTEPNFQSTSAKVDNLEEGREEIGGNGEFKVSGDCRNISEHSNPGLVLKLDESPLQLRAHSLYDVAKRNMKNYLNPPLKNSEGNVNRCRLGEEFDDVQRRQQMKRYGDDAHPEEPSTKIRSFKTGFILESENGEFQKYPSNEKSYPIPADTSKRNYIMDYNDEELITDINIDLVKDEALLCDLNKSEEVDVHYSINDGYNSPEVSVDEESFSVAPALEEYNQMLSKFVSSGDFLDKISSPQSIISAQIHTCPIVNDDFGIRNDGQETCVSKRMENVSIVPDKVSADGEVHDSSEWDKVAEEGKANLEGSLISDKEPLIHEDKSQNDLTKTLDSKDMLSHSDFKTEVSPVCNYLETTSKSCKFCQDTISGDQNTSGFVVYLAGEDCVVLKLQKRPLKIFLDLVHHENHQMIVRAKWAPQLDDLKSPCAKLAVKSRGRLISEAVENLIGRNVCSVEDYLMEVISAYAKVMSLLKELTFIQSTYITDIGEEGLTVIVSSIKAHLSISLDVKFNFAKNSTYTGVTIEPRVVIGNLRKKTLEDALSIRDGGGFKLLQMIKSVDFVIKNLAR